MRPKQQPSRWPELEVTFFAHRRKPAGAVGRAGLATGSVLMATSCCPQAAGEGDSHQRVPAEVAPGVEMLAWRRLLDHLGSRDGSGSGR